MAHPQDNISNLSTLKSESVSRVRIRVINAQERNTSSSCLLTKQDKKCGRKAITLEWEVRCEPFSESYDQPGQVAGGSMSPLMGVDVDQVRRALRKFAKRARKVKL